MSKRIIIFRRYNVSHHPNTGKTIVHLHGLERRCLGFVQARHYENLHLSYVPNEPTGKAVKRAIDASDNHWRVGWLTRMIFGIK